MATYFNSEYVAARRTRTNRWQDWANVVLAIWLFISPWVLAFGSGVNTGAAAEPVAVGMVSTAAWNAWVMAVLVFLVGISAISQMEMWQEWLTLIFGAWIFAAPWALGFTRLGTASWDHWVIGALVFLISVWSLSTARQVPVGRTTTTVVDPPANRPPREPMP